MITYVASLFAKPGHELEVTKFYQDLEPLMREAPGVRRVTPPEQLKGHAHEGGPEGVHFIMVEQWDSVADRVAFSMGVARGRNKDLFPHLLPQHSHEFYEDVTPAA
jgi:quinol monooxygenase YgiN